MPFWSREESKEPQEPVAGDAGDQSTSDGMEAAPEVGPAASDATASESSDAEPAAQVQMVFFLSPQTKSD